MAWAIVAKRSARTVFPSWGPRLASQAEGQAGSALVLIKKMPQLFPRFRCAIEWRGPSSPGFKTTIAPRNETELWVGPRARRRIVRIVGKARQIVEWLIPDSTDLKANRNFLERVGGRDYADRISAARD